MNAALDIRKNQTSMLQCLTSSSTDSTAFFKLHNQVPQPRLVLHIHVSWGTWLCSAVQWLAVKRRPAEQDSRGSGGHPSCLNCCVALLRLLLSCLKLLWLLHWTWPTSCLNCCTSSLLHLTQLFIVNCTCSTQVATCTELQVGRWGGIQLSESGGHVLHCGLHCSAWHHWICCWWCYVIYCISLCTVPSMYCHTAVYHLSGSTGDVIYCTEKY